ncbi:MAG: hypothetical protein AAF196_01680 [Planctomycetota bacterium]
MATAGASAFWSVLVALQEPRFFRSQGLQIGWEGVQWAVLFAGTLTGAVAVPDLSDRLRLAIRRSRRPHAILLGVQFAWIGAATALALLGLLTLVLVGTLRGLQDPGDTLQRFLATWTPLVVWSALLPGVAAWTGRLTTSLGLWLGIWILGLTVEIPLPLRALTSTFSVPTALLSAITAHALSVASIQFRLRSDRRPR